VYRKVLFLAPPSKAIEAFAAAPARAGQPDGALMGGNGFIENECLRVTARGALIELLDKRTGQRWPNLNLLEEEADAGDAWDFAPPWTPGALIRSTAGTFQSRLTEMGGVRATLRIEGELLVPERLVGDERSRENVKMRVAFDVSLYRSLPRADVKMTLVNTARDHRIRLRVPTGVRAETILSQGHLAILERPVQRQREIEPWLQPPTPLMPCREWIAARDGEKGLAVAMKGLYDYEAAIDPLSGECDLCVTLLRGFQMMGRRNTRMRAGAASEAFQTPGAQCLGEHVIEWSYLPYKPDPGDIAPFLPLAQSFLYPPVAHALRTPGTAGGPAAIPRPFSWSARNVQFSAFKESRDGKAYILRLYENQGRETALEIELDGFALASLAGLDEQPLAPLPILDGRARVFFGRYKAVTIRLE
jgi:alpha-mannosidase